MKSRYDIGYDSKTPVVMTANLLHGARAVVPDLKKSIEQKENQICVLLGRNPGPIPRGKSLLAQNLKVTVPPGLTSDLLERRPDIRYAEDNLVAANARIGEAKAALFPTIKITGVSGWDSAALKTLLGAHASFWDIAFPSVVQPIFTAGRLRAQVRATRPSSRKPCSSIRRRLSKLFGRSPIPLWAYGC